MYRPIVQLEARELRRNLNRLHAVCEMQEQNMYKALRLHLSAVNDRPG